MSALIARFGEEGGRLHARATWPGDRAVPGAPCDRSASRSRCRSSRRSRTSSRSGSSSIGWSAALTAQLTARGLAADRAILALELDLAFAPNGTAPRIEVEQRFPEPTADAEAVERLLFARLEREPPPAAVQRLELELRGDDTGRRPATAAVRASGRADRPARLAARTARADLRGGSGQAGRDRATRKRRFPRTAGRWRGVGLGNVGPEGSTA